jgi:hypothetical protein
MTKPKPRNEHKPNPRALTAPLHEQPVKQRRNRARYRALRRLAAQERGKFSRFYSEELAREGLG